MAAAEHLALTSGGDENDQFDWPGPDFSVAVHSVAFGPSIFPSVDSIVATNGQLTQVTSFANWLGEIRI